MSKSAITIRNEQPQDEAAVRRVNVAAFGQPMEADIVDRIRRNCSDVVSLVALIDEQIVGHILFSPANIQSSERTVHGMGLAPMAVLPEYQRQGLGTRLVRAGIEAMKSRNVPFVIVLGHPEYYPRFGFETARRREIRCEWDVPEDVFMILVLDEASMGGVLGLAKYRAEFSV